MKNRAVFLIFILVIVLLIIPSCKDPEISVSTIYTVSFQANGGSPVPLNQVSSNGGKISEPEIMTKANYIFVGWFKEKELINQWNFDIHSITNNITLYAKWNPEIYTVSFNANGGNYNPEQQNIAYGEKVVTPSIIHKTGFGFGGWFKEADCINAWDFHTDIITGNLILYAMWDINFHIVSFEPNGGNPTPEQQEIAYNCEVLIPSNINKTGYGLVGWFKEPELINLWDFDNNKITENITLYAKWDVNYYKVNFYTSGGSPSPQQQNIAYGGKITEPTVMNRTGYTFGGWYKETIFTNQWDFSSDIITNDITLYAKWNIIYYTVNFDANGGNLTPQQQSIAYGGKAAQPPTITKIGYTFDGWYKEETLNNKWNFNTDIASSNIILYAKWLENFTVTFEANGGNPELAEQIVVDGNKISIPIIGKTGFNLEGWYKEADFINIWDFNSDVVKNNIILYAKWGPSIIVPGATLNTKLQWLENNVQSYSDYTIEIDSNVSISRKYLSYANKNNVNITLKGIGANRIISLSENGSMFTIGASVTLILDNMIELRGKSNGSSLVQINSEGKLILNNGARIADNTVNAIYFPSDGTYSSYGGGVNVASNGIFIMNGGEITGNTINSSGGYRSFSRGGGVYIASNGTFIMNGGTIFENTAVSSSTYFYYSSTLSSFCATHSYGGGVFVDTNGNFILNDGEIYSNNALSSYSPSRNSSSNTSTHYSAYADTSGGGVYVNGNFTMYGGKITTNAAKSSLSYNTNSIFHFIVISYGGGVFIGNNGILTMSDGVISNNTISASRINGGGSESSTNLSGTEFYIETGGILIKTGGAILNY